jgi:transcriptional regulator GlxA family with amidase domain
LKNLPTEKLSKIEKETIAEIRAMRARTGSNQPELSFGSPVQLVHHFILSSHGNVQLRISVIARELGVGMRTLERAFAREYQQTMSQCQVQVRLSFSKWMLSLFPPTKISVVAALLGYEQVQDFNRFFKRHMNRSPSDWSSGEHKRGGDAAETPVRNR